MNMYCKFHNEWNSSLILCRLEHYVLHCCLCCGTCSEHTSYSDPLIPPIEIGTDLLTLEKGIREI